ncbi:DUF1611 domain-containing protein [bacterium]|nr:DUF1611 domain-containing protein [bacterium]
MTTLTLRTPYLLFVGSETEPIYAKTAAGLAKWSPEACMGQLSLPGGTIDLGLAKHDVPSAARAGAKSLVIGTSAVGGAIPSDWMPTLLSALSEGMDIVAGVHTKLNDIPELVSAAMESGAKLVDVRVPPKDIPVGTGKKRTGNRLLTVGTDCALGKKYTALAISRRMVERGVDADFRASGQTGIMIAGNGIPIDAVVADFLSGAAEMISPDAAPGHWDIIEGQGSLFHPGYSSVSTGLLIGSQPDAFVVCTEALRTHIKGWPDFELPSIQAVIDRTIDLARVVNPNIRCVGISVNTSPLPEHEREAYLENLSKLYGLPTMDPLVSGVDEVIDRALAL